MNINRIETGRVKVTKSWRIGRGEGVRRLMTTLLDSEFSNWLPIYVWAVEHPVGVIIIDTGIPANANKRVWFLPYMPLVQRAARFDMTSEQEVGPQLRRIGLSPDDVRWVALTHLHQDHDDGLNHFPNAEFVLSRKEWAAAAGFKGRMNGYLNHRWPNWFQPRLVDFDSKPFGPFASHHSLTQFVWTSWKSLLCELRWKLVAATHSAGRVGSIDQPFLAPSGQVANVDGQDIQRFECDGTAALASAGCKMLFS